MAMDSVREKHIRALIGQQQRVSAARRVTVLGREWVVEPRVHDPTLDSSSRIITEFVVGESPGRLVDVGTGTGIVGITAALDCGADVVGTDINIFAVENANRNARLFSAEAHYNAVVMDLLSTKLCEWADMVVWNSPYLNYIPETDSDIERNLADHNYVLHRRFFQITRSAMADIFLVISRWADEPTLRGVAAEERVQLIDMEIGSADYTILKVQNDE